MRRRIRLPEDRIVNEILFEATVFLFACFGMYVFLRGALEVLAW